MSKKRLLALTLAGIMAVSALSACGSDTTGSDAAGGDVSAPEGGDAAGGDAAGGTIDYSDVTIGSCIYKFDDTFMTNVRNAMTAAGENLGCKVDLVDSQNKQPEQNNQVDTFITKGVSALAINAVDRTAAGPLVEKAKAENLPIVFLNREPEADVMDSYDKIWYVGAKAEESGTMSGEIIADYWAANPEADRNGDGKLQYIMVTGEPGHQDATLRTEYSVKAITDAGIEVEELGNDTAMWDKVKATDLVTSLLAAKGVENVEAILCNNDDMALGAIEALKAAGYNTGDASKFTPVVGVDATDAALQAMQEGGLLGTVLNDAVNQGTATVNIAAAAATGQAITKDTVGYEVTDADGQTVDGGKYVWIPYVKVTADNYQDYMK